MITVQEIDIQLVKGGEDWEQAKRIRAEVFVGEQGVAPEDELDEYEEVSRHLLLRHKGQPTGACRWRYTDKGIKLERFAILKDFRGKGLGKALLESTLADIGGQEQARGKTLYLHAQTPAVNLYKRQGFTVSGGPFDECGIWHYYMEKQ